MGLLNYVIAFLIGLAIWKVSMATVRMLATPPPEVDPADVEAVNQSYKCTVCGAELVMTVRNVSADAAPRHCREDMDPVWRPD